MLVLVSTTVLTLHSKESQNIFLHIEVIAIWLCKCVYTFVTVGEWHRQ